MSSIACENSSTAFRDWHNYYFNRLKVGIVTGIAGGSHLRSGVGKSYTAIREGQLFDKDYMNGTDAIDKIVFRPRDFPRAMEAVESSKRAGQVVVIDEAGILVNSKKWYNFINRSIADAIMTFRNLRGMAIFVTPAISLIDKDIRLFVSHMGFCNKVMSELDSDRPEVRLFYYQLYWDETKTQYYKYRLQMYNQEAERLMKFKYFQCNNPEKYNPELMEEYENKSKPYKREVRSAVLELDRVEKSFQDYVTEIIEDKTLIKETPKGLKVFPDDIRFQYDVPAAQARLIGRRVNEALNKKHDMSKEVIEEEDVEDGTAG